MKRNHVGNPALLGYMVIDENGTRVPRWDRVCQTCGKPVRTMTGLRRPGGLKCTVFWHAAGSPGPEDPRRGVRSEAHSAAISRGMRGGERPTEGGPVVTDATALLREMIERLQGRQPRFRYFECKTCRRGASSGRSSVSGMSGTPAPCWSPTGRDPGPGIRSDGETGSRSTTPPGRRRRPGRCACTAPTSRTTVRRSGIGSKEIRGGRRGVVADPGSGAHPAAFLGVSGTASPSSWRSTPPGSGRSPG